MKSTSEFGYQILNGEAYASAGLLLVQFVGMLHSIVRRKPVMPVSLSSISLAAILGLLDYHPINGRSIWLEMSLLVV